MILTSQIIKIKKKTIPTRKSITQFCTVTTPTPNYDHYFNTLITTPISTTPRKSITTNYIF